MTQELIYGITVGLALFTFLGCFEIGKIPGKMITIDLRGNTLLIIAIFLMAWAYWIEYIIKSN